MATKKTDKKEKEVIKPIGKLVARVTEKASNMMAKSVYTFNIPPPLNKTEIKKEIFKIYKVKPIKINVLSAPKKRISFKGKMSVRGGGRKALVYLKEGDKIEL